MNTLLCCSQLTFQCFLPGRRGHHLLVGRGRHSELAIAGRSNTPHAADMRHRGTGRNIGLDGKLTDPEPLPPNHPLLNYENVIITPHTSGYAEGANQRLEDLVVENTGHYLAGRPLRNQVNLQLRY